MRRSRQNVDERRDSPRFDVPLFVRSGNEGYVERFGRLSINGFYFETDEILMLGQVVDVKLVLLGIGMEVNVRGLVISLSPAGTHVGVAARFEEISFDTERMIARWLDLMSQATARAVAV